MDRSAPVDHPVHELIARRWSPRAFANSEVEPAKVLSMLEAARWAASCANEQPWRFVVGMRGDDAYRKLLECLVEGNRVWAAKAPLLMLSVARTHFAHSGKPNPHAWYDAGQAATQLALQATALGLQVHQMAGFDRERARALLAIPEGFEPIAAMAVGYPGEPELLPEPLRERERAPRRRLPMSELIHGGTWGEAPAALGGSKPA